MVIVFEGVAKESVDSKGIDGGNEGGQHPKRRLAVEEQSLKSTSAKRA